MREKELGMWATDTCGRYERREPAPLVSSKQRTNTTIERKTGAFSCLCCVALFDT